MPAFANPGGPSGGPTVDPLGRAPAIEVVPRAAPRPGAVLLAEGKGTADAEAEAGAGGGGTEKTPAAPAPTPAPGPPIFGLFRGGSIPVKPMGRPGFPA
mmetsp:Transcript_90589/g.198563  ORF Transcript_90589/g.198563 Transcript_90589/m.198563 type:complete len:99 (-) Transcript_90589:317-613(-)